VHRQTQMSTRVSDLQDEPANCHFKMDRGLPTSGRVNAGASPHLQDPRCNTRHERAYRGGRALVLEHVERLMGIQS